MSKIFFTKFAQAGSRTPIDVPSQPDGKISYEEGWPIGYELPQGDPGYKPIDRAEMNGLVFELTDAIGELQMFGFAEWQPGTWPKGARVRHLGELYVSTAQTTEAPPHSDWEISTGASFLESKTFQVGPTGDFATITDALTTLSRYFPLYKAEAITCELKLQNEFQMAEQIIVGPGVDLSWINITSEKDVSVTGSGDKELILGGLSVVPMFWALGGHTPTISARFKNESDAENLVAFAATGRGSVLTINKNGGAESFVAALVTNDGARINAADAKCSKNGSGILCVNGSEVWAPDIDLSESSNEALLVDGGKVWAPRADLRDAGDNAIKAENGAEVFADDAICVDAGGTAVRVDASRVSLRNADVSRAHGVAMNATNGSVVIADGADISRAAFDGVNISNSDAFLNGANMSLAGVRCLTASSSRVWANNAIITQNDAGFESVSVDNGSALFLRHADLSGNNDDFVVTVSNSTCELDFCIVNNGSTAVFYERGSIVRAYDSPMTTSSNINELTAAGIFFKYE